MRKYICLLFIIYLSQSLSAQAYFPNNLHLKNMKYKGNKDSSVVFDFSENKKKAFLFFDYKTKETAQVLYIGANFIFDKTQITIFPICYTGYLSKKPVEIFETEIPIQLYTIPLASEFSLFDISELDFPILVIYNEQNQLCGFTKNVGEISKINCDMKLESKK